MVFSPLFGGVFRISTQRNENENSSLRNSPKMKEPGAWPGSF
jgi:hypothetical protein